MKASINDWIWTEYLLWAKKNFEDLESQLSRNQFDVWEKNIANIKHALDQASEWIKINAKQE